MIKDRSVSKKSFILFLLAVSLTGFSFFGNDDKKNEENAAEEARKNNQAVKKIISEQLASEVEKSKFKKELELNWDGEKQNVFLNYTIDEKLQSEAQRLLRSYKPDYAAIVVIEPKTGKVIVMTSFQKNDPNHINYTTKASFPAASIFKVVTATAAIDKYNLNPDFVIPFNGGNHTLYKRNLFDEKTNRWTKEVTLKQAFAKSFNTAFGKLSLKYMKPQDLQEYAQRFQFNQVISADFPVEQGFANVPQESGYELAEVASGFNKINKMSPVQGAMMAAAIAEDGVMRTPYIVDEIKNEKGETLYNAQPEIAAITMTPDAALKVRTLMEETITKGTSRKSFRRFVKNKKFREVEVGGKTGSLTGDEPKGKVDWFVGYARSGDEKIAIAAITVNKKNWTIKSSQIAEYIFKKHYSDQ